MVSLSHSSSVDEMFKRVFICIFGQFVSNEKENSQDFDMKAVQSSKSLLLCGLIGLTYENKWLSHIRLSHDSKDGLG